MRELSEGGVREDEADGVLREGEDPGPWLAGEAAEIRSGIREMQRVALPPEAWETLL